MSKFVYIMMVMLFMPTMLSAQNSDRLYVYQHSGPIDSLALATVKDISHSRLNLKGETQSDYVVMVVSLKNDDMRQYLLADIDSVVMVRGDIRIHLTRFVGGMTDNSGNRSARRTSLDGDFMASTSEVDFFWEEGDHIYLEDGRRDTLATISDTKRTGDFYFGGNKLTADNVTVYYAGQTPIAYNNVRVAKDQTQQTANNTEHIGVAGDCGTATAAKQQDGSYRFNLDHHAAYLCFLPYISNDLGRTVLKSITVRSGGGLAGDFTLTTAGLTTKANANYEHTVTLTTGNFVLPRNYDQNTSAYMVIAPQSGATRLTCEFTVYDNLLGSTGVYTKTVDLKDGIARNTVYVIKANCNNYVIDLGLPVKFMNHNMGATAPEEYGGYYAWGELEDKGNYSTSNYTYQNTSFNDLPKNIRLTDMDVAHMRLGGSFSMPTLPEMHLLLDSCSWSWQPLNSKPGYVITGKNGNKLFMPAAGYRSGTGNNEINDRGLYRSSQLSNSGRKQNWYLNFYSYKNEMAQSDGNNPDLYYGESIRPVVSTGVQMTDGSLVQVMTDSVKWTAPQLTAKFYGTVYGYDKAKDKTAIEIGFVVGKTDSITIADGGTKVTATVSADGPYYADFTMPKDTAYYYRAYAMDADGNVNYANALQFGRCYVDLGLPSGTKWANINVGATRPDEDGDYFSWAEVTPKSTYSDDNYKWSLENTWVFPEGLRNVQATHNDAASVNWGGTWMLPDYADLTELIDNCESMPYTLNGVVGYLLKSNINGNTIFFSKSGYHDTSSHDYASRSCMASSELQTSPTSGAYFISHASVSTGWYRRDAISVRPVYKTNATSANGADMYLRTLPAAKNYDGSIETDTLKGVIRGLENAGNGNTYGFVYWKDDNTTYKVDNPTLESDGHIKAHVTGLVPGVNYHYAVYVDNGTNVFYGDTLDITTIGMVDLGLSVKWANVNIGAENEYACGDYYRWGATAPYRNKTQEYQLNVDITPSSGFDIVSNLWGSNYRMPTKAEMEELVSGCDVTWTTRNGVNGCLFTGKGEYADRSIFLPAGGWFNGSNTDSRYQHNYQTYGDYWTSTVISTGNAYRIQFKEDSYPVGSDSKIYGFTIRAVQDQLAYVETKAIERKTKVANEIDELQGYVHVLSGKSVNVGFEFSENADMSDAQQLSAGTKSSSEFKYTLPELQKGKTYYYRAYATDDTKTQYGNTLSFELLDYVDLGLPSGTLWANMNVGASSSETYGDYFAYAETSPKDSYTQDNYKFYKNGSWVETGYDIAGTEYDAAKVNLGELWCIPTHAQCNELFNTNYVSWELVTVNGYYCCKVTSKMPGYEGKYILIPRGGRRSSGSSWTSEPGSAIYAPSTRYNEYYCYDWVINSNNSRWIGQNYRYYGYTMRPVINKNNLDTIAPGVIARVLTDSCKWTIGDNIATLYGTAARWGAVSGMTYGFVVGTIQEVDTDTPAAANVIPASNINDSGKSSFSIIYSYNGSAQYYRAYVKVDNKYYFGDIKSITSATLLSAEFKSDGTIFNSAPTNLNAVKTGSPTPSYNSIYKHYEVAFANTHGSNSSQLYSFDYRLKDEFKQHLADGHSIEALIMLPNEPTKDNEADAIASYENGGSGLGILNKEIYTQMYINGEYQVVQSGVTPVEGLYYHVVAVYDKNYGIRLYVDGVEKNHLEVTGTFGHPSSARCYYTISGNPNSNNATSSSSSWPGTVVFARIYDDALTESQVKTLYNNLKE